MTGIDAFLEILAAAGERYIFGNPGTTELPLTDALARDRRFEYILGLQEIPVTAMADGYAQASGRAGVVCLHACCGLGNALGMIYNAHCAGTPLLILAGQQDRRLRLGEPVLEGDTVSVVRPWTKWAVEVQLVEDIPVATRRAYQMARTPPTGPVFLSIPVDLQWANGERFDLRPPHVPDRGVRPPSSALREAAALLARADSPAILAGSRVAEAHAPAELVALAETLGAPVYAEAGTAHGRLPMPAHHPLYAGPLPLWTPEVRQRLQPHDVLLVVGMNLLRLYLWHEADSPLPASARLIHLDQNAREIGKNFAVEVGLVGDPKAGLAELVSLLANRQTAEHARQARRRLEAAAAARAAEQARLRERIEAERPHRPLMPYVLMDTLARVLPPRAAVVEEAVTTHHYVLERLGVLQDPTGFFAHRGWALGWGIGAALGVRLAWPDRPVLALLGDGAALYGIQGLWTAAHYRLPVAFVIANNAQYKILKVCGDLMPLPEMARKNYVALDLTNPEIDFVSLARAFGVEAHRVAEPDELADRLSSAWKDPRPILLDVPIER
ncbi:MAG: thiamine pyrophosphate-binding protein [Gemmataceae bacterium]|nr:thiamine pyrophosphate-binding protein [Gemmataceae bacterium]MDW8265600.1 thiamine pyrophosphate-binding protein [Gemmataceae bacterium]